MEKEPDKFRFLLICIFLAVSVFALYWPVHNHDFIRYDDDTYITLNRNVHSGINCKNICWAFTKYHSNNWHPVTWISHMLDCKIFGLNAGAHHLVNVFFHIINTLLLFIVFKRMTKALWISAFIAAVFGLHPLHTESVAWIAERKDVLSTFFWLLTMLAYFYYTKKRNVQRYLLTLVLFVLGLMAKPMLVTLPFVLLLLDYWPLERMRFSKSKQIPINTKVNNVIEQKPISYLFLEKIPFFIFAFLSSIVTFIVQRNSGAVKTIDSIDITSRIGNAFVSYIGYISKVFWPSKLAILYPYPLNGLPVIKVIICALALVGITAFVILLSRRRKYFVTGWFWYIVTLIPVIGLVQVGMQSMADRYTYIPMTGLLIIIAYGISELIKNRKYRNTVLSVLSIAILFSMFVKTSMQLKYWQNSQTLFERTLEVTQNNYIIENNYANYLCANGQIEQAIAHLNKSLAIKPDSGEAHNNLANIFNSQGNIDKAIEHYKISIKFEPDSPQAHHNFAIALTKKNMIDQAINEYNIALHLDPSNVESLSNLGFLMAQKGNYKEAFDYYRKVFTIDPCHILTHCRYGYDLAQQGHIDEAIAEYCLVLKAQPDDVEMHCNLGFLLECKNQIPKAIELYRAALHYEPDNERARTLLQEALKKMQAQP